jgi:hypothetical protein
MATAITRERIAILNRKLKRKITMEIIDLKDEQGEARERGWCLGCRCEISQLDNPYYSTGICLSNPSSSEIKDSV